MPDITTKTITLTARNFYSILVGFGVVVFTITTNYWQFQQVKIKLEVLDQRANKRYERDRAEFESLWDAIDVLRVKGSDHEQSIQE